MTRHHPQPVEETEGTLENKKPVQKKMQHQTSIPFHSMIFKNIIAWHSSTYRGTSITRYFCQFRSNYSSVPQRRLQLRSCTPLAQWIHRSHCKAPQTNLHSSVSTFPSLIPVRILSRNT